MATKVRFVLMTRGSGPRGGETIVGEDGCDIYLWPTGQRRRPFIVVHIVPQVSKKRVVQWENKHRNHAKSVTP